MCNTLVCILIALRLRNNKTSVDLRKKVLQRHFKFFAIFSIFLVYSVMWLFSKKAQQMIFDLVRDKHWSNEGDADLKGKIKDIYELLNFAVFNIPAIPIALLRIMEPYVFQEVKRVWYQVSCRKEVKSERVKYS